MPLFGIPLVGPIASYLARKKLSKVILTSASSTGQKRIKNLLTDKPQLKKFDIDPITKKAIKVYHKPIISKVEASLIGGFGLGVGTEQLINGKKEIKFKPVKETKRSMTWNK